MRNPVSPGRTADVVSETDSTRAAGGSDGDELRREPGDLVLIALDLCHDFGSPVLHETGQPQGNRQPVDAGRKPTPCTVPLKTNRRRTICDGTVLPHAFD